MEAKTPLGKVALGGYKMWVIYIYYVLIVEEGKKSPTVVLEKIFCSVEIVFPMPGLFTCETVYRYSPGTAPYGRGV